MKENVNKIRGGKLDLDFFLNISNTCILMALLFLNVSNTFRIEPIDNL